MEVKYYAENMQDALDKIKRELGPDAVVVSSQQVRSRKGLFGFFAPKVYEVIASYEPQIRRRTPKKKMDYKQLDTRPVVDKQISRMQTMDRAMGDIEQFVPREAQPMKKTTPRAAAKPAKPVSGKSGGKSTPAPKATVKKKTEQQKPKLERIDPPKAKAKEEQAEEPQKKNRSSLDMMVERALQWEKKEKDQSEKQEEQSKIEELDDKLEKLNVILDQFSSTVQDVHVETVGIDLPPELEKLYSNMIEADTSEQVAKELIDKVRAILKKRPEATEMEVMDHVLRDFIGEVEEIQHKKFEQEVIMLIGPTGVGKTTTLVKLASHFVTQLGLKVGIINTDVYRVGAQEQLKTYAEILSVPMITVYNPDDIAQAVSEFEDMDMIFIDTAGKVSSDQKYQQDVQKMIELAGVDEIYLAVSGSTQLRNLKELFENYAFLGKHNLIVTKMDEGSRSGMFLNMRKLSGRPLSYTTTGQNVPDDIQKTDVAAIISEILRY